MEKLWEALWNKLTNDATLVSMTKYTTTTKTIKESNNTNSIKFNITSGVTRAVTYGEWTDVRNTRAGNEGLRDITFMLVCWSKINTLECVQLKDYLITLLDEVNLTNTEVHNPYSEYDDFCTPPYWDKEENMWRIDLRFRFICKLL